MRTKKILTVFLVLLLLLSAACRSKEGSAEKLKNSAKKITNVSVEDVVLREMIEKIILPGLVLPDKEVVISAEAGGIIERIPPEKGDRIKKGAILAEIDRKQLKAVLDRTEAGFSQALIAEKEAELGVKLAATQLDNAERQVQQMKLSLKQSENLFEKSSVALENQEKQFERVEKLYQEKLVSQAAYDNAESQLRFLKADYQSSVSAVEAAGEAIHIAEGNIESARAQLESARLRIDTVKAEIRSQEAALTQAGLAYDKGFITTPFDSQVDDIFYEEGEFIKAESALMRLISTDPVLIKISLPEKDIPFINPGGEAKITIDSLPGRVFEGLVSFVGLSSDTRTNTYPVEIKLDNSDSAIKPGMIAQVTLVRIRVPEAVSVPNFAVIRKEKGEVVFILEGNRAVKREVKTGILDNGWVQITEGLAAGEKLIVKGHRNLEDGEEVRNF